MSFKKRVEIHDTMMVLHKAFMDDATDLKIVMENLSKDEIRKRVNHLISTMKNLAQLVDKALEFESR